MLVSQSLASQQSECCVFTCSSHVKNLLHQLRVCTGSQNWDGGQAHPRKDPRGLCSRRPSSSRCGSSTGGSWQASDILMDWSYKWSKRDSVATILLQQCVGVYSNTGCLSGSCMNVSCAALGIFCIINKNDSELTFCAFHGFCSFGAVNSFCWLFGIEAHEVMRTKFRRCRTAWRHQRGPVHDTGLCWYALWVCVIIIFLL